MGNNSLLKALDMRKDAFLVIKRETLMGMKTKEVAYAETERRANICLLCLPRRYS